MTEPERIDVEPAYDRVSSPRDSAMLVCAYEDEGKCRKYRLEGAISLRELMGMKDTLDRNQEIVFYCA